MNKFTLALLFLAFMMPFAYAHLDAGEDRVLGDYLVDFGYAPEQLVSGNEVTISFNLINQTTQQPIVPADVWVRISNSKTVVLAGTFYPEADHVAFNYLFPSSGSYDVLARFKNSNATLVETTFKVSVKQNPFDSAKRASLIILAILIVFIFLRRKKKKHST